MSKHNALAGFLQGVAALPRPDYGGPQSIFIADDLTFSNVRSGDISGLRFNRQDGIARNIARPIFAREA